MVIRGSYKNLNDKEYEFILRNHIKIWMFNDQLKFKFYLENDGTQWLIQLQEKY